MGNSPGPWRWEERTEHHGKQLVDAVGRVVLSPGLWTRSEPMIEVWTENAALIAQAPAMLARIAELEAANAELLATLANERGEGEAPCEGWRYIPSLGDWQSPIGVVRRISWLRLPDGASKACWGWERWEVDGGRIDGVCDTARSAMRAASSQGADVPKEQ